MNTPIDAVITWVDGYDPAHQEKLNRYLSESGLESSVGAEPTRFNQVGEIVYCVRSILLFAPWIRRIYIVTDNQRPSFLTAFLTSEQLARIVYVDHMDIFKGFEHYIPTFNSLSIESLIWRIKGLSERFIYFNDDCFLIRPVAIDDFFRNDCVVVRGEWKKQTPYRWSRFFWPFKLKKEKCNFHRQVQESSAKKAGYSRYFFNMPHVPFPLYKQTMADFFDENQKALEENICYRIRDTRQFWSLSLAHHLDIKMNRGIRDDMLKAMMVNGQTHSVEKIERRLQTVKKKEEIRFLCMQSLDKAAPHVQKMMLTWLDDCLCSSMI